MLCIQGPVESASSVHVLSVLPHRFDLSHALVVAVHVLALGSFKAYGQSHVRHHRLDGSRLKCLLFLILLNFLARPFVLILLILLTRLLR